MRTSRYRHTLSVFVALMMALLVTVVGCNRKSERGKKDRAQPVATGAPSMPLKGVRAIASDEPSKTQPIYALPFSGRRGVSQASDGKTHQGAALHAVDFPMPRGTPILAARAGVVVNAVGEHEEAPKEVKRETGKKGKPNLVAIQHDDGTVAFYLHLEQGGALVKKGERVRMGQLIGTSGSTGKSSGPHLHFNVMSKAGGRDTSLRVKFSTSEGDVFLEKGSRYRAPGTPAPAPGKEEPIDEDATEEAPDFSVERVD